MSNSLRIVFMGTPDFAVPTLEALIQGPHEVVGVFCQPDKPKGRGKQLQMPPVKECALAHDIPVYQPLTLKTEEAQTLIHELAPDVIIVVAYGRILPDWLIDYPKYGCINVHASLLPKYRGAAPIHYAVLNGDTETGVTIMHMDYGLDTGDVIHIEKTPIAETDTTGTLFERLSILGGSVINEVIEQWAAGSIQAIPQDHEVATHTSKVTKEMGNLDWSESASVLCNRIRALNPAPGCYTNLDNKRVKIWQARVHDEEANAEPGTIVDITKEGFVVATGKGSLLITEAQPANKKRMAANDFCRGYNIETNMRCVHDEA